MSEISLQKKGEIAFKTHQEFLKLKNIAGGAFILMGEKLQKIRDEKLYRYIDENYKDFETYLADPEIQIERRKAYYLINIYQTFCSRLSLKPEQISDLYWTSLREIAPIVDEKNYKDWLEKARTLTRSNLLLEIRQAKKGLGLKEVQECSHIFEHKVHINEYWQCSKCGERTYVRPERKEKIVENEKNKELLEKHLNKIL